MKNILFISLLLILPSNAYANKTQEQLLKEFNKVYIDIHNELKGKNLLERIIIQKEKIDEFSENPFAYDTLQQLIATDLSFAGLHGKALYSHNYQTQKDLQSPNALDNFQPVSAINEILTRANDEKIVMINEAHHITQHRVLSIKLLKGLWDQGYKYFALEALGESGKEFVSNNFITSEAGYYTQEPLFAHLLIEAKKLGFKLISYDYGDQSTRLNREMSAGKNLASKIFKEDPDAKVLIHCGYSHIKENDGWLAEILHKETGINPFTVNQTHIVEQFSVKNESPIYAEIINQFDFKEPIVLKKNGSLWSARPNSYDVNVIWPRTTDINGRPSWALLNRKQVKVNSKLCNENFPCLIEVYEHFDPQALPSDRIMLESVELKKNIFVNESSKFLKVITPDTTENVYLKNLKMDL